MPPCQLPPRQPLFDAAGGGHREREANGVGSDLATLQEAFLRRHDPSFLRGLSNACAHLLSFHMAPSKGLSTRVRDLMPVHAVLPEGFEFRNRSRAMTLVMLISDTLHRLDLAAISGSIGVCVKVVKLPHQYVGKLSRLGDTVAGQAASTLGPAAVPPDVPRPPHPYARPQYLTLRVSHNGIRHRPAGLAFAGRWTPSGRVPSA